MNKNDWFLGEDKEDFRELYSEKLPSLSELLIEQNFHDARLRLTNSLSKLFLDTSFLLYVFKNFY